jgi:hypothetical protein
MNACWIGQVPRAEWTAGKEVSKFQGQLEVYLAKFQDPAQSDSMSRLQSDLDETKIILVGPEYTRQPFFLSVARVNVCGVR